MTITQHTKLLERSARSIFHKITTTLLASAQVRHGGARVFHRTRAAHFRPRIVVATFRSLLDDVTADLAAAIVRRLRPRQRHGFLVDLLDCWRRWRTSRNCE